MSMREIPGLDRCDEDQSQGAGGGLYCELNVQRPEDVGDDDFEVSVEEHVMRSLVENCFPSPPGFGRGCLSGVHRSKPVDGEDATERHYPYVCVSGINHAFAWNRAPLREVLTLSHLFPNVSFSLSYWRDVEETEFHDGCVAVFEHGELVHVDRANDVAGDVEDMDAGLQVRESSWLRGAAARILEAAYDTMFQDVEGSVAVGDRERVIARKTFDAYEVVTCLLEPIDQQILEAQHSAFRVRLDLGRRRRTARSARTLLEKIALAPQGGLAGGGPILSDEDLQQINTTMGILKAFAGGMPPNSKRTHGMNVPDNVEQDEWE